MSIVSADRAVELISEAAWSDGEVLRAFWLKVEGPRDEMAKSITRSIGREEIVALVVRDNWFGNPNQILSDMHQLLETAKAELKPLSSRRPDRLTVVILVKQAFDSAQVSSPITLPHWFPVRPGLETHFFLTDLVGIGDGALLSCPEAQIERIAELVYGLERALVASLVLRHRADAAAASAFLRKLMSQNNVDVVRRIAEYQQHVANVASPRGYRPNASGGSKSFVSDALRLILANTTANLAKSANELAPHFPLESRTIKPSYLGVSLRPKVVMSKSGKNWYAIFVGLYQSYQAMNASAHAGEYGLYPAALVHYSSLDLQSFLADATGLLE